VEGQLRPGSDRCKCCRRLLGAYRKRRLASAAHQRESFLLGAVERIKVNAIQLTGIRHLLLAVH